jgi:hypothetical protein
VEYLAWGLESAGPICDAHLVMVVVLGYVAQEAFLPWSREARHCVLSAFEVRNTVPLALKLARGAQKKTDKREKTSCP